MIAAPLRLDERLTDDAGAYFTANRRIEIITSPYQTIEVFDTPALGKLMRIDGCNMVSEGDEFFYHEALVHPAATAHANPREVLIIGGGDGGSAEEILKHATVSSVTLVELDQAVIDVAGRHFQSVHRGAFASPRLDLHVGDGMAFVESTSKKFDLILLDLTDPAGAAEALYRNTFFASCRRTLHPDGALVLHLGSPFSHPARVRESIARLRAVFALVTSWFVHVPTYGATWGFAAASDKLRLDQPDAAEIDQRLAARCVAERRLYNGAMHHAMQVLPPYVTQLIG
jgi:spermidine synthase